MFEVTINQENQRQFPELQEHYTQAQIIYLFIYFNLFLVDKTVLYF